MGGNLQKFFFRMGARVKQVQVAPQPSGWQRVGSRGQDRQVVLDIKRDRRGPFFEIRTLAGSRQELLVLNAEPRRKHLLLLSRQFDGAGRVLAKYNALSEQERKQGFRMMKRDAAVYVRGEISHPDHRTVHLEGWHRVFMNTENRSMAMRNLAFLD